MRARPQHAAASLLCTGGRYGSALPLGVQLQAARRRSGHRVQLHVSAVCAPRTGCSCTCVGLCAPQAFGVELHVPAVCAPRQGCSSTCVGLCAPRAFVESSCISAVCAPRLRVAAAPARDCALLEPSPVRVESLRLYTACRTDSCRSTVAQKRGLSTAGFSKSSKAESRSPGSRELGKP